MAKIQAPAMPVLDLTKSGQHFRRLLKIISSAGNTGCMGKHRRKGRLSIHQKQMRFLTMMLVVLLAALFTGLLYWINR